MDTASRHQVVIFLLQLGVMLAVALACGQVLRRLRQPPVLGELLGGILLGPTVLGLLAPGLYGWLFPANGPITAAREAVIKIGMLFFLFVAGLEVDLRQFRRQGLGIVLTSSLGSLLPFCLGFLLVYLWPGLWGGPGQGRIVPLALTIGTALSISALPVIARILLDLGLLKSELGTMVMAAATISDLLGWSFFAILLSSFLPHNGTPGSVAGILLLVMGFAAVALFSGRTFGPAIGRWARATLAWPSGYIGVITVLVLAAAALAEALGIHAFFGAFLVGVALGHEGPRANGCQSASALQAGAPALPAGDAGCQSPAACHSDNPVPEIMYQFAISFFAPLYFVSVGLKADFLGNFDPLLVLVVLLTASGGKILGASLGAWLGGMPRRRAMAVGAAMNARGAMEIILASIALDNRLIDLRIFVALVVMALATSLSSGPALAILRDPG